MSDILAQLRAEWAEHRWNALKMTPMKHFIERLFTALEEYERSFALYDAACRRGAQMWRAEKPTERELISPDTAKLVAWLLEKLEESNKCHMECVEYGRDRNRDILGLHEVCRKLEADLVLLRDDLIASQRVRAALEAENKDAVGVVIEATRIAEERERLVAQVVRLREALKPFAATASNPELVLGEAWEQAKRVFEETRSP